MFNKLFLPYICFDSLMVPQSCHCLVALHRTLETVIHYCQNSHNCSLIGRPSNSKSSSALHTQRFTNECAMFS